MTPGLLLTAAEKVLSERLARLNHHGMLACECTFCRKMILVETNMGPLACPHCQQATVQVWCAVEVQLVPEVIDAP